ncbi:MAG: hypothetical protein WCS27_03505 [Victivallaceae bacterium]
MLDKWLLTKNQISVLILNNFNSTAPGFFWSLGIPIIQSLIYFFAFSLIMVIIPFPVISAALLNCCQAASRHKAAPEGCFLQASQN